MNDITRNNNNNNNNNNTNTNTNTNSNSNNNNKFQTACCYWRICYTYHILKLISISLSTASASLVCIQFCSVQVTEIVWVFGEWPQSLSLFHQSILGVWGSYFGKSVGGYGAKKCGFEWRINKTVRNHQKNERECWGTADVASFRFGIKWLPEEGLGGFQ